MKRNRADAGRKAQRSGDSWECSVEANNWSYEMAGTALVERLRLTGRFVKGKGFTPGQSPVDFVGDIKVGDRFVPIRFDAKSFAGTRWDYSDWKSGAKKHHQLIALRHMARFGGAAFVLVRQSKLREQDRATFGYPAWLVPLAVVEHFINLGQWSMSVEFLDSAVAVKKVKGADWLSSAIDLTGLTPSANGGRL